MTRKTYSFEYTSNHYKFAIQGGLFFTRRIYLSIQYENHLVFITNKIKHIVFDFLGTRLKQSEPLKS